MADAALVEKYWGIADRVEKQLTALLGRRVEFTAEQARGAARRGELRVRRYGTPKPVVALLDDVDAFARWYAAREMTWKGATPVEKGTPEPEASES